LAQPCEDDVLHHVWFLLLLSALCYHRRMTPHDQQRFGRITLVGLIIAIFGVAFMFGGTSRYFGVASAFGMGTGGVGRRHKVWLSDRLESETDHYARACEG